MTQLSRSPDSFSDPMNGVRPPRFEVVSQVGFLMGASLAKTFTCYAKGEHGEQLSCTVHAEQTMRPRMIGRAVVGQEWQWQYFIESQNQILVRRSKTTYE